MAHLLYLAVSILSIQTWGPCPKPPSALPPFLGWAPCGHGAGTIIRLLTSHNANTRVFLRRFVDCAQSWLCAPTQQLSFYGNRGCGVCALKSNAQGKDTAEKRHESPGLRVLLELFLLFQLGPLVLLRPATRIHCSRMTAKEFVACRSLEGLA